MRLVQSSPRRKCANSCNRMTLRSSGGSSRKAHAGRIIVRFQKPIAAGTRTHSDVDIVTGAEATMASTVFRTTGSRSAATTGVQLCRSRRKCQSPSTKRAIATNAPSAHATNPKSAQVPGIVIAGWRRPHVIPGPISARPSPKPPHTGSAATVSNARNQTANRVPEFCFRKTRSNAHAKTATNKPSGSAFRMRSIDICATLCRDKDKDKDENRNEARNEDKNSQLISHPSEPASPADDRFPLAQHPDLPGGSRPVAPESS